MTIPLNLVLGAQVYVLVGYKEIQPWPGLKEFFVRVVDFARVVLMALSPLVS